MTVLRADIVVNNAEALTNIAAVRQQMREAYAEMSSMSARPMSGSTAQAEIARGASSRARDEARRAAEEARHVGRAWREEYRSIDQIASDLSSQMVDSMRASWQNEKQLLQLKKEQLSAAYDEARVRATFGTAQLAIGAAVLGFATKSYSEYQRFEVGMTSLLGETRGKALSKEMNQYAVRSAFDANEVRRISQMMLALGFQAESLKETIGVVTNVTAMSGGDSNQMYRLALALSQIKNMGGLRGQERNQLAQAGVPLELVAQKMGMTMKQLMESRGSITYDQLFGALKSLQADRGDIQARLSESNPAVAWQNLMDSLKTALLPAGQAVAAVVIPIMRLGTAVFEFIGNLRPGVAAALVLAPVLTMMWRGGVAVLGFWRMHTAFLRENGIQAKGLTGQFMFLNQSARQASMSLMQLAAQSKAANARSLIAPGGAAMGGTASAAATGGRVAGGLGKIGTGAAANAVPGWGQVAFVAMAIWGLYDIVTALMEANSEPATQPGGTLDGQPMNRADMIEGMARLDWKS